jgi:hypothetical protein
MLHVMQKKQKIAGLALITVSICLICFPLVSGDLKVA